MPKNQASAQRNEIGAGTDWAAHDFGHAKLGDARLVKRLIAIAREFSQRPAAAIPQACGNWARTKAAYRFFDNDSIEGQAILDAHVEATLQRTRSHAVVLCLQDTTSLNYSKHPQTQGLGPIGNNRDTTMGLLLHSTLAVTPAGHPLGLLHAQVTAREARTFGRSAHARNRTPISQKESQKWIDSYRVCQALSARCPDTTLVSVADREGDLYDLFVRALVPAETGRVNLLVRARHNRQVAQPQKYLGDFLSAQRVRGHLKIRVPRQTGQPARLATLAIRFATVPLQPPCLKENQPSLTLWAVEAREVRPPKGAAPICWRLLTTQPVTTVEAALEKVGWYARRWQIEVLHKVLKSGCQVEQRQLKTAARLKRLLLVDLIVAWRVMALCKAGRETPEGLASDWFSSEEWRALLSYRKGRTPSPQRPPTIRHAVRWIAQLGGFLARRRDGEPGPIVVWRGLQQLRAITLAWRLFQSNNCG